MAEKLYGYCGSKCKHEVYSKTETYSKEELKARIAVINGNATCPNPTQSDSVEINYPSGFNQDNCVVISFGAGGKSYLSDNTSGFSYGYLFESTATGYMSGAQSRNVKLMKNKIRITYYNPNSASISYYYKIVLMRID